MSIKLSRSMRLLATIPLVAGGLVAVAAQQPPRKPQLAALAAVEPGQWQLAPVDAVGGVRSLCIQEASNFIQVEHVGATCSRFVIDNLPRVATVHYTCPGAGHGRTTIRVEAGRQLDIQSQGIANNAPFDVHLEARRTGRC